MGGLEFLSQSVSNTPPDFGLAAEVGELAGTVCDQYWPSRIVAQRRMVCILPSPHLTVNMGHSVNKIT